MGRGRGGGGRRGGVSCAKPADPPFIRRMKEQLGFKEGPTLDSKREAMPELEHEDGTDRDDELPTVVVLKSGDLTAEEVEELGGLKELEQPEEGSGGGGKRVIFKKPLKRAAPNSEEASSASKIDKKESSSQKVKNKSLLSFDDEEDDDGGQ